MEFSKAQKYSARVSEKYFLNEKQNFLLVKLELVDPDRINFIAGQYISIKINDTGERRSYSIASSEDVKHGFSLVVEIINGGKGSQYMLSLNPGDFVEILGPLGRFAVKDEDLSRKLLFVATGSGIAPIGAMINDLLINKKMSEPIRLHWGMRDESNVFWFDNFERLVEEHNNFVFDLVLSRPSSEWELCSGHVQDCLRRDFVNEDMKSWSGYVCGNPEMVGDITKLFITMGLPENNINSEKFS